MNGGTFATNPLLVAPWRQLASSRVGRQDVNDRQRLADVIRFYSILDAIERVGGRARTLATCSGRMVWPRRGVYFFLEEGENRSDTGTDLRVVRVGTHALKAESGVTLWRRLAQHRGSRATGGGNHRGSICRLLVGTALINRNGYAYPTWGKGSTASRVVREGETLLEREVSRVIGAMSVVSLGVDDEPGPLSLRGYIERNAIALLSNYHKPPLDPPSVQWLGRHSDREKVRSAGLWNQNHVDDTYDPAFLDVLAALVTEKGADL